MDTHVDVAQLVGLDARFDKCVLVVKEPDPDALATRADDSHLADTVLGVREPAVDGAYCRRVGLGRHGLHHDVVVVALELLKHLFGPFQIAGLSD